VRPRKFWLKSLGRSREGTQIPDRWDSVAKGLFRRAITFARRPDVQPGDGLILYASGTRIIFAAVRATSFPYKRTDNTEWPWQVDVEHIATRETLHEGEPLDVLAVDGREHNVRIRRRSHVNLTEMEFAAGVEALRNN
jgi:hypothetical protein